MDLLTLIQVVDVLDHEQRGTTVADFQRTTEHGFRLVLERDGRRTSVTLSARPGSAWIGCPPPSGGRRPRVAPGPFAAAAARGLRGAIVERIDRPYPGRVVRVLLADGRALLLEAAGSAADLVLLDGRGRVTARARGPRASRSRPAVGEQYRPPRLPPGRLVPPELDAAAVDARLEAGRREGRTATDALRRAVLGLETATARLVVEESRETGASAGAVLALRIRALLRSELQPAIEAPAAPREAAERGEFSAERFRLLPWPPFAPSPGTRLWREAGAAATAGLYHEAQDRAAAIESRARGLETILAREHRRVEQARRRAAADLEAFRDPDRHRRWGEALLAGLHAARRSGDHVFVPDPYDPEGKTISVPADARLGLPAVAEEHFRRHRRARRGQEGARRRARALDRDLARIEALRAQAARARGGEAVEELERGMRDDGIPVGLERHETPRSRSARGVGGPPRVEGVRMFRSSDGLSILAGKGGRDNHRLTFRIAAPDDFWLHALGVPGAHVVVRNPERLATPPRRTLLEAAGVAAYYSDLRGAAAAEVQWTRRKYVRRARNAPPGTVLLKRFQSVRVAPGLPGGGRPEADAGPACRPRPKTSPDRPTARRICARRWPKKPRSCRGRALTWSGR